MIVGAGAMGGLAAAHLRRAEVAEIVVLNRTLARAPAARRDQPPSTARPARAGTLDALAAELPARRPAGGVHGRGRHGRCSVEAVVARDGRPLAVCDLGLPHDVDPAVADAAGRHA